tara:strand:+ start:738 stop:902 length:165 start_codon:yes stop_codon:yes gene_type:complete
MGKTYKKNVKNKFEKKKLNILKQKKLFIEDEGEDEQIQNEEENLSEMQKSNRTS